MHKPTSFINGSFRENPLAYDYGHGLRRYNQGEYTRGEPGLPLQNIDFQIAVDSLVRGGFTFFLTWRPSPVIIINYCLRQWPF